MAITVHRRSGLLAICCVATLLGHCAGVRAAGEGDKSAAELETLPGFKVELVAKADPKVNGSWISLGKDDQGRLLLGGQRRQPMTRVTLDAQGKVTRQEVLKLPISEIMGQLYINGALYVDGSDGQHFGLFRLRDARGDGSFGSVEMLREWRNGSGEHGAHAIHLGPDHKLYIVCGNFTELPQDLIASSPHKNYADDLALPRVEDGNGFGAGKKPPGGFICRMDLDGKNPELFASGDRNTYDVAFNPDGELLGFDSDMEWDWGTPWYRPIRVYHATSAADQGFREGSAKWPEYYADSLPAVVNIGIGCPTGVTFGTGAKFPAKYQKAFYITDWTYGRLMAAHLAPRGSSYKCTSWENFVTPKSLHADGPKTQLQLTGLVIGKDGALYFTVGGRGTQAALYRVSYVGSESTAPANLHDADGAEARAQRHKLEAFHGHVNSAAVDAAWPFLDSKDRFIRYAARIAIEAQPVAEWKAKALAETKPQAALTGLLALARLGGAGAQADVLNALAKIHMASLPPREQLVKLRVIEVSISRQGKPSGQLAKPIIAELDPLYPAKTIAMNRELCQVLLALDAPDAVAKTVKLLDAARTQEEQLNYVLALRTIKDGWTPDLRKDYFSWWTRDRRAHPPEHPDYVLKWFDDAGRPYGDGASYSNFIKHIHEDAVNSLSADEKTSLADVIEAFNPPARAPRRPAKVRKLVKEWKMADLEPLLAQVSRGRSYNRGKAVYQEAQCSACHKFGNDGGSVGPDLTAISSRFARRDILESIILPSKVISEQYMNTAVRQKNGDVVIGRLIQETPDALVLQPDQLKPEKITVKKSDVQARQLSKVSPMPEGLVNTFTQNEILDLLAYMESAGRKDHPDFVGGRKR
ncbi:MAG TPA: c-type cytochrome [Tepidisphaeraceae bacterium]|nr:c-type cytochrome [Tepidisphaeraceae bacterium]